MTKSLESGKRETKKTRKEGRETSAVGGQKKKCIIVPTDIVRSLCVRLEA